MSARLFIGNLSFSINDDGLRTAFAPFGELKEAHVITDRETQHSRGFGFVTFAHEAAAIAAIAKMHRSVLEGRTIEVQEAKPRQQRH